ncbi:MAG: hypothetical protein JWM37_317 [Candidatus Saccharibacteria bacterium]|nr:hypothetical protein [Candidatus Saccharibacteria bacterium]
MRKISSTETIRKIWTDLSKWIKVPLYILMGFGAVCVVTYGIATWYIHKHNDEPFQLGTTFISGYAEYYELDPHETLQAILGDLGMRHLRFVSYWDEIESTKGVYDFSDLDWQMDMAEQYGAKVTLAVGLRQPRWPECHAPTWVNAENDIWKDDLNAFMTAVVNRYKGRVHLESYQLENEYFLDVFGECHTFGATRERLQTEFNLIKSLDPSRPIILSLSNNYAFPVGEPVPDVYGVSVYKRVFDYTVTHRYFEYPFPSWYYAARAGIIEMRSGKESVLHELQTEPWGPIGVKEMSIAEQDKTMNAELLTTRVDYAKKTGFRTVDTWGAEWWYWRKQKLNDPSLWNAAKDAVADSATH